MSNNKYSLKKEEWFKKNGGRKNWQYAGGCIFTNYEELDVGKDANLKYFKKVMKPVWKDNWIHIVPAISKKCQICTHPIINQLYITDRLTNTKIYVVGSVCINDFRYRECLKCNQKFSGKKHSICPKCRKEEKQKKCVRCNAVHKNRKDNFCNNCRVIIKNNSKKKKCVRCGKIHNNRKYNFCNDCGKTRCSGCGVYYYNMDRHICYSRY
jgi:hypothetical protein